jgi:hypothetical protein
MRSRHVHSICQLRSISSSLRRAAQWHCAQRSRHALSHRSSETYFH